mmetsp:Transcript_88231/g.248372  ORF Transcript_88231/g.248372 Transcript_88231/m.248372 type:complete len:203 (-) Transcript_88231:122-730(-)
MWRGVIAKFMEVSRTRVHKKSWDTASTISGSQDVYDWYEDTQEGLDSLSEDSMAGIPLTILLEEQHLLEEQIRQEARETELARDIEGLLNRKTARTIAGSVIRAALAGAVLRQAEHVTNVTLADAAVSLARVDMIKNGIMSNRGAAWCRRRRWHVDRSTMTARAAHNVVRSALAGAIAREVYAVRASAVEAARLPSAQGHGC